MRKIILTPYSYGFGNRLFKYSRGKLLSEILNYELYCEYEHNIESLLFDKTHKLYNFKNNVTIKNNTNINFNDLLKQQKYIKLDIQLEKLILLQNNFESYQNIKEQLSKLDHNIIIDDNGDLMDYLIYQKYYSQIIKWFKTPYENKIYQENNFKISKLNPGPNDLVIHLRAG